MDRIGVAGSILIVLIFLSATSGSVLFSEPRTQDTKNPVTFAGIRPPAPLVDTIPPEFSVPTATPDPQDIGGLVNISADIFDDIGVNLTYVNITFPDASYLNTTMDLHGTGLHHPAWGDIDTNTQVSAVAGDQEEGVIVPDGNGGAFMVWQDGRGADRDIYAQHFDPNGTPSWVLDGLPLTGAAQDQRNPRIAADGSGGIYVVWEDQRNGTYDIYGQRLALNGTLMWGMNGLPICTFIRDQQRPSMVAHSSGGLFVIWTDSREITSDDIYAQFINASGIPQWTLDGIPITQAFANQDYPYAVEDQSGDLIVVWSDRRALPIIDLYGQRLDLAGTPAWTADGEQITANGFNQYPKALIPAATTGAIVIYREIRAGDEILTAQHISPAGNKLWGVEGTVIFNGTGNGNYGRIIDDLTGGTIITWPDDRDGTDQVFAQRLDASGNPLWGNGTQVSIGGSLNWFPDLIPDGDGGAILTWYCTDAPPSICAQQLDDTGSRQWGPDNFGINANTLAAYPRIISDTAGGAIIMFRDYRTSSYDQFAQRITDPPGWFYESTYVMPGEYTYQIWAKDHSGNWNSTAIDNFTITDLSPPVADAGPDQVVNEDSLVIFDGSGSTDNLGVVNHTWTFNDPGPHILYGEAPTNTFAEPGIYPMTLDVRDAAGYTDLTPDTMNVTVLDVTAPVANAGPNQTVSPGQLVTFDGSGSSDNVAVVGYTWTFADPGPQVLFGMAPGYVFTSLGTFNVTLNVTDGTGWWALDIITITVIDTQPPVADAGPDQAEVVGVAVDFDGFGSTDNMWIANFTWTFDDDGPKVMYGMFPSYAFILPGPHIVTLDVTDPAGNHDLTPDTVTIFVFDFTDPIADAGPDVNVSAGNIMVFNGSGSSDNVGIENYTWTFVDGGPVTLFGVAPSHIFADPGAFVVTLNVWDSSGNDDNTPDTVIITVLNTTPTADAGLDDSIPENTLRMLNGSASWDDVGILNYTWTFDDLGLRTLFGVMPWYNFSRAGLYQVTLNVTDGAGFWDTDIVNITVQEVLDFFNISLEEGLNLISFPFAEVGHPSLLLNDTYGDNLTTLDLVRTFDTTTGTWSMFSPAQPSFMNDLIVIDNTMGLWVRVDVLGDGLLTLVGSDHSGVAISYTPGWNLVGYPYQPSDRDVTTALVGVTYNLIEGPESNGYYGIEPMAGTDLMLAGRGYWIRTDSAGVWNVPR